jgi:RimJ/RimL family protein N-acetyltransferase
VIELLSPFPPSEFGRAWDWLNEYPERNLDDYGPQSREAWIAEMERRAEHERTWGVVKDGELVGIIGYLPLAPRCGWFHGICFTRSAWGRATTQTAVEAVIQELFATGVEKISASYFADNPKIHRFLADLGAVEEGLLRKQTLRGGELIDMRLVAIFKRET